MIRVAIALACAAIGRLRRPEIESRMATFSFTERRQIEQCLGMGSGYVLDFSNRTFEEFILDAVARNIYNGDYSGQGSSKANHLRAFFAAEPDHVVGALLTALVEHGRTVTSPPAADLLESCKRIADRLKQSAPVLGCIATDTDEPTFAALSKEVRRAIESNQPETGLDRLHAFFVMLLRRICEKRGVQTTRDEPAHSVLGKYIKHVKGQGHLHSEMSEKILKYALATMDAFNQVRNNQSLAHPNEMLNSDEALLVFNHVVAIVNFIQSTERRIDHRQLTTTTALSDSEFPF